MELDLKFMADTFLLALTGVRKRQRNPHIVYRLCS